MTPRVIGPQRRRELFYIAQGALVALLGFVRLSLGHSSTDALDAAFPYLMVAVGLALAVAYAVRFARASEGMTIDDRGVTIRRPHIGEIPWWQIGAVRTDRVRSRQFLHVALVDADKFLTENPRASRWIAGREVWFDTGGIDLDAAGIAEAIELARSARA